MKAKKYYVYEMNLNVLNVFSVLLFLLVFALTIFLYKIEFIHNWIYPVGLIFILMIPYLIFHELLHSFSYVIHGANFNKVTYGAHLEKGVLCCLCKQNITRKNILISLIYPFFFLGVVTYVVGIILDSPILISLSIINISGCAGDLIMFFDFLFLKNFEYSEFDNPIAFGIYSEKDLSKKKMFGLTYKETVSNLKIKDLNKISISKTSIIMFIIILIIGVFWMFI